MHLTDGAADAAKSRRYRSDQEWTCVIDKLWPSRGFFCDFYSLRRLLLNLLPWRKGGLLSRKPEILRAATITLGLLLLTPIVRSQEKPTARLLLDQMAEKYSRLVSYQDEGIVKITFDEETGGRIEKLPFKTSFKRPNLVRFEWTDYFLTKLGKKRVVWSNGKESFTYWEPDRYEKEENVGRAIAGAKGKTRSA